MPHLIFSFFVCLALLGLPPAYAQQAATKAGGQLTPMGAQHNANHDGTIPAWSSSVDYAQIQQDQPLFVITAETMAQHASKLAPGHMALMSAHQDFHMPVYPTRRSCTYPDHVYKAAQNNLRNAALRPDGAGVTGAIIAPPFPQPDTAEQVIWNHLLRYRGHRLTRQFTTITPTIGGRIVPIVIRDDVILDYADPALTTFSQLGQTRFRFVQHIVAPQILAGTVTLIHDAMDHTAAPRKAWQYIPEIERALRAPVLAYDSPQSSADQLATVDQYDMFNGALDRYNWSLQGKTELYVPYNSDLLAQRGLAYGEILNNAHVKSRLKRYELHRVWVVEAKLKPSASHKYHKRVFYIDEDSWTILHVDIYAADGTLWRVQEGYLRAYPSVPLCTTEAEAVHDLKARRIYISGLKNNEPPINWKADNLAPGDFTPHAIQAAARKAANIATDSE